jgi:4-hydroxyphenylacetate 3-monooxygenase
VAVDLDTDRVGTTWGEAMTGHPMVLGEAGSGAPVNVWPRRLVVAGYTGRDRARVQHHIDELTALGVAPPESVPAFYDVPVELLTLGSEITVASAESSGEVEPVLLHTEAGWWIGIGSDHTARDVERDSIPASKACCGKPMGGEVLPLDRVEASWAELRLRSSSDYEPYQNASLAEILPARDILATYLDRTGATTDGLVMFLGTVPVLGGAFRYGTAFTGELADRTGPLLSFSYKITRRA